MGEIVYEPRAFWTVQRAQAIEARALTLRAPREHFKNGERHPVTLEHFLIAGIGYALEEFDGINNPPLVNADRDDCAAAIQRCKVFVSAPGRQQYTLQNLGTGAWPAEPSSDISMRNSPTAPYSSGKLGVSRWDFSRPMDLPRGYSIDFRMGGVLSQPAGAGQNRPSPSATVAFYEEGGLMRGNSRLFRVAGGANFALTRENNGNFPFPPDGLGGFVFGAQAQTQTWPYTFNPSEFRRQQASQAGRETVSGFAVHIDQIDVDDDIQDSLIANVPGSPVASLALRMPVWARVRSGGSGIDWWREGAPLALVCPSLTPAQVYKLPKPITLHPGDVLTVEVTIPEAFVASVSPEVIIAPTYQIGFSFTGYAAIEG